MSWNHSLYIYHKKQGGQFLADRDSDDGMLILAFKDHPLVVDIATEGGGRFGPFSYVRARLPVALARPYELTIGAEKALSGGVNTVLRAVPGLPGGGILPADFGFPEVTKKRLIRSDNFDFTKLVLGSLDFRNALLSCPGENVKIRPGPGTGGLHLITVTTASALHSLGGDGGSWYLSNSGEYTELYASEEDKARRVEEEFFPRMDRFLTLARAACGAVTQWPM